MLIRFIFTLSIFLPILVVYAHELSHHEHQECENTTLHFHDYEDDCCLDDFIATKIYSLSVNKYEYLVLIFNYETFEIEVLNPKKILLDFFKRGPPLG